VYNANNNKIITTTMITQDGESGTMWEKAVLVHINPQKIEAHVNSVKSISCLK
jgi:hypothetical protein